MGRSFEAAFEAEFASLHRYLARRLGASAADDLAAETFAVAFRSWERLDPDRPVRPWLYGIAANLVRHHWRKERRMLRAYARTGVDPVLGDEDAAVERADAEAIADDATTRRTYERATSSRRQLPRRRLVIVAAVVVAIAAPTAVLGSEILHGSPSPTSVALHLQRQFISYVAAGAKQDPGPRFPHVRRANLLRALERAGARFHYSLKRLGVIAGRDGAPLIVVRARGSLAAFSESVGALERRLDPPSRTPRIASDLGATIEHTRYEGFFLEAVDSHDIPFLVVWEYLATAARRRRAVGPRRKPAAVPARLATPG